MGKYGISLDTEILDDKMKEDGFEKVGILSRRHGEDLRIPVEIVPSANITDHLDGKYAELRIVPYDNVGHGFLMLGGLYVVYGKKD